MKRSAPLLAAFALLAAGCPPGENTAGALRPNPHIDPRSKCGQPEPLVVEWEGTTRAKLEAARARGLIAVRYDRCELEILDCHGAGRYAYVPITPKSEKLTMRDADALYANVPLGAAGLESKLKTSGALRVDMNLVGRFELDRMSVRAPDLEGDCDRVTHFVRALNVGAFTFSAGGSAELGGDTKVGAASAGGSSESTREVLSRDGDPAKCASATAVDLAPPAGCGAVVRVELAPVELTDAQQCARAGARLVSCGVVFDPKWPQHCALSPQFPSCARSAGDDCKAVSMCAFKAWGPACVPSGTQSCREVQECYAQCGARGQSVVECNCACTLALDPQQALRLAKANACYNVRCLETCGPLGSSPCYACFERECAAPLAECRAH